MSSNNILLLGSARHGKDTVAQMLKDCYGLTFKGSSEAAAEIFLYDALKDKYGYQTPEQCFNDRTNHRAEWYDLICEYNKDDRARLAKDIMAMSDIYVGMRDNAELEESVRIGLFDCVIGVYDPRKPLEPATSFNIDIWQHSDFVISNAGSLDDLKRKVAKLSIYTHILL